jgi:Tannase and feruloyl esterase
MRDCSWFLACITVTAGRAPNFFDALATLEQWVERGRAPDQMVATKYANDDSTQPALRTACSENQDLLKIGPNGAGAASH